MVLVRGGVDEHRAGWPVRIVAETQPQEEIVSTAVVAHGVQRHQQREVVWAAPASLLQGPAAQDPREIAFKRVSRDRRRIRDRIDVDGRHQLGPTARGEHRAAGGAADLELARAAHPLLAQLLKRPA